MSAIKKLRVWGIALMTVLIVLCAVQCTENAGRTAKKRVTKISFWHANSGKPKAIIESFVEEFNSQHQGECEIIPVYQGAYSSLQQKLYASIMAHNQPMICQLYETWTSRLIQADKIVCIQDLIDEDPEFKESQSDFIDIFIRNNSWDDKLYTLPFNKSTYVLFVNEELLVKAGIDTIPSTWAELEAASVAMTKRSGKMNDVYGMGLRPTIDMFSFFMYQNGGSFLKEDSDTDTVFTINSKENVEALSFIVDLVKKQKVAYVDPGYMSTPFGSQRIGMYIGSSAGIPYVQKAVNGKFRWNTYPLPAKVQRATIFQGTNVGLLKNAQSDTARKYGWEFIKFLTNKTNNLQWSTQTGYVPVRQSVLESEGLKDFLEDNPYNRATVTQYQDGFYDPRIKCWVNVRQKIQASVAKALNQTLTPQEALDEAQKEAEKILSEEI